MVPCRRVNSPPHPRPPLPPWYGPLSGGLSWGQQTHGDGTVCVLLASSSFWLQVDPTWWRQDGQNHAPTISVLAPLPLLLLPSWRVLEASRWLCWNVSEACKGPSSGQQAYGESTVWGLWSEHNLDPPDIIVILASS